MKIAIAGTGYVGLSNAVLLAQHNEVVAIDIVPEKVAMLNRKQSPIEDAELEHYLATKPLRLRATLDKVDAYSGADFVVIAKVHDFDLLLGFGLRSGVFDLPHPLHSTLSFLFPLDIGGFFRGFCGNVFPGFVLLLFQAS